MCGVIGLWGHEGAAPRLYDALLGLQHRGQDAAGITTYDGSFHTRRGLGLVRDLFDGEALTGLTGTVGLGQVRYPTVGGNSAEDAQPLFVNSPYGIAMAHNGNVTNYHALRQELVEKDRRHIGTGCDVEVILNVFALALERLARDGLPFEEAAFSAVAEVFRRARGAYAVVALIGGKGMLAFRDPLGIRPLVLSERATLAGPETCLASESVAGDLLGFTRIRDVRPGEAILFGLDGSRRERLISDPRPQAPCIFEHIYFARPDSVLDGVGVYQTRQRLGRALAESWRKTRLAADVVIPVPDSACAAALAMAEDLGIPYREGFVKNRYVGRTFIMPVPDARGAAVRRKLNAIPSEFAGRDVLLVDDSLVRGTTSRSIVQMARQAGARSVHLALCAPPLRFPCVYGIDISTKRELIAREQTVSAVAAAVGADTLVYQDVDALVEAGRAGNPALSRFCTACFTGEYPTEDITPEMFAAWEQDRGQTPRARAAS
jgi:amidophosphoribosyltransferase